MLYKSNNVFQVVSKEKMIKSFDMVTALMDCICKQCILAYTYDMSPYRLSIITVIFLV